MRKPKPGEIWKYTDHGDFELKGLHVLILECVGEITYAPYPPSDTVYYMILGYVTVQHPDCPLSIGSCYYEQIRFLEFVQ